MNWNTSVVSPAPASSSALSLASSRRTFDVGVAALLTLLCLPYLMSGVGKLFGFSGAVAEFTQLGLPLPGLTAALTIVLQLGASVLVIAQRLAWLGAIALAVFTVAATLIAHAFWNFEGPARFAQTNIFFEHMALAGAFLLVALLDLRGRRRG